MNLRQRYKKAKRENELYHKMHERPPITKPIIEYAPVLINHYRATIDMRELRTEPIPPKEWIRENLVEQIAESIADQIIIIEDFELMQYRTDVYIGFGKAGDQSVKCKNKT